MGCPPPPSHQGGPARWSNRKQPPLLHPSSSSRPSSLAGEERHEPPCVHPVRSWLEQQDEGFSPVMQKVEGQGTPVNLPCYRGASTPGSPATGITARVNDQVVGYRDLAALPRDKAILQVERPDLMTYQPHLTFSPHDPPPRERSLSPPACSPTMSPEVKARRAESETETENVSPGGSTLQLQAGRKISGSQQHFHRPDNGANIYRKPPIYKQDVNKHVEGSGVIRSAMFPAAQPPDPNLPSKIETEYWPCPPSLAAMEIEWRKKKELQEEDEFEDLTGDAETLREQELEKIKSNLGRLILKEEKEKAVHFRRKTQSLPDRSHMHTSLSASASKSPSHTGPGLTRMQSAEFATDRDKVQPVHTLHYRSFRRLGYHHPHTDMCRQLSLHCCKTEEKFNT
ncbi:dematin-like [Cottoperca gobio]|uniref:Dematin-like n=1 Tax=Cottoperca gobio TaxID=56716 RepID=A0A6J2PFK5_COTGO|nr:dematin-like [Cottoperca gobio]